MVKDVDIPPVWLCLALLVSWGLAHVSPVPLPGIGVVFLLVGGTLMLVAVAQMILARTTFIPRRDPVALVTGGVFRLSRNPIYLGDALILTGAILYWGAWLALPLVPLFVWWITNRYILDEEARLRRGFGPAFDDWAAQVPRWIGPI